MTKNNARAVDWVLAWTLWALRKKFRNNARKGVANILHIARTGAPVAIPRDAMRSIPE